MLYQITLVGLFLVIDCVYGSCGKCQTNFVACRSSTSFSLCVKGAPSESIVSCPAGKVCTDQPGICVDDSNQHQPTCNMGCEICSSHRKLFSCLSETTFGFCFGEAKPFYTSIGSCLDGYVCNLNSPSICIKDTESMPSCKPRDDATFCSETAVEGRFKAEGDTTCTKYYICKASGSGFKGYNYICDHPNYFNPESKMCEPERPANC